MLSDQGGISKCTYYHSRSSEVERHLSQAPTREHPPRFPEETNQPCLTRLTWFRSHFPTLALALALALALYCKGESLIAQGKEELSLGRLREKESTGDCAAASLHATAAPQSRLGTRLTLSTYLKRWEAGLRKWPAHHSTRRLCGPQLQPREEPKARRNPGNPSRIRSPLPPNRAASPPNSVEDAPRCPLPDVRHLGAESARCPENHHKPLAAGSGFCPTQQPPHS